MKIKFGAKIDAVQLHSPKWSATWGKPAEFLERLKDLGVDFIEFPLGEETDLRDILRAGESAIGAKLSCSLHPYLHGEMALEIFDAQAPAPGFLRLFDLAQTLAECSGDDVSLIFHGGLANYEPHYLPFDQALAAGNRFFRWAERQTAGRFPNVRVYPETQLPHNAADDGLIRMGDTYERCLELLTGTDLGICWDVGHAWWSVLLGKQPETPPAEFLRRVGHVHLHDAFHKADGGFHDHLPLGRGKSPWRRNLHLLADSNFSGRILLEVPLTPEHFSKEKAFGVVREAAAELQDTFTSEK